MGGILQLESWHFANKCDEKIHDGADRRIVVEADERVHIESFATKHDLDHNHSNSFKGGTSNLEKESRPRKLYLSKTRDGNAKNNNQDVEKFSQVRFGNTPGPGGE